MVDTFIEVAEDCQVRTAEVPHSKGIGKTVAVLQYEMIANSPYRYTQEDVLYEVHAIRNVIPEELKKPLREQFFSKGQPCLRTSALGKRYGWGIHHNAEGKIALFAVESEDYQKFLTDKSVKLVKAMRSSRA